MVQYKYCVGYVIPPALSCLSGALHYRCQGVEGEEYGHIKSQNRCVRIYNIFISAILQHREVTVKEGKCNYESLLSVPTFFSHYLLYFTPGPLPHLCHSCYSRLFYKILMISDVPLAG